MFGIFKNNESKTIEDLKKESVEEIRKDIGKIEDIKETIFDFKTDDEAAKEYYKTWEPPIKIEKVGKRTFIKMGDVEFCANYCSNIQVKNVGSPPEYSHYLSHEWSIYKASSYSMCLTSACNAVITATMVSGKEVNFSVNRHALDIVLEALREAWKEALKDD